MNTLEFIKDYVIIFFCLFCWGFGFITCHMYASKRINKIKKYWQYWYDRANYYQGKYYSLKEEERFYTEEFDRLVNKSKNPDEDKLDSADWWRRE